MQPTVLILQVGKLVYCSPLDIRLWLFVYKCKFFWQDRNSEHILLYIKFSMHHIPRTSQSYFQFASSQDHPQLKIVYKDPNLRQKQQNETRIYKKSHFDCLFSEVKLIFVTISWLRYTSLLSGLWSFHGNYMETCKRCVMWALKANNFKIFHRFFCW